tara:strand:+ start:1698 stop:2027 length:330 start_codon:yes stop_codon:yes gene_type:complete
MAFDKTNTAIAFVEDGLFNKGGVESLGRKPILVVKANIDGVEKEISLWFAKDKDTGEYKVTTQGHKFLTGKVDVPYNAVEYSKDSTTTAKGVEFSTPSATLVPEDDIPF